MYGANATRVCVSNYMDHKNVEYRVSQPSLTHPAYYKSWFFHPFHPPHSRHKAWYTVPCERLKLVFKMDSERPDYGRKILIR